MNWYRIAVLGWLLTMVSCVLFGGGEDDEEEPVRGPRLVGRIASVNEQQRFVLIEGYGEWILGDDLLLSSYGGENERAATLVVSGERMGRFAAADWKSGEVKVGDVVYARPSKEEVPVTEEGLVEQLEAESTISGG
jgi:hypothetical protein